MYRISVDTGTTNSRVLFFKDSNLISKEKIGIGIRDVALTKSPTILESSLVNFINKGMQKIGLNESDIMYIVGSGMITSNLGLCEIPYLTTPVSIKDLGKGIKCRKLENLDIPFYFIPGLKNKINKCFDELEQIDVMRGEEVETFGIVEMCNLKGNLIIILPGSHTKFVIVDEESNIVKCESSMLGEIFSALAKDTILSDSLSTQLIQQLDKEYIIKGIDYESKHSLTKAAFATRLMHIQMESTENQRANFLCGALISNDLNSLLLSRMKNGMYEKIIVGGSSPLKEAFKIALNHKGIGDEKIKVLEDNITEIAPSIGAFKVIDSLRSDK